MTYIDHIQKFTELRLALAAARAPLAPDGILSDVQSQYSRGDLYADASLAKCCDNLALVNGRRWTAEPVQVARDILATLKRPDEWPNGSRRDVLALVRSISGYVADAFNDIGAPCELYSNKHRYEAWQKLTHAYELTGSAIELLLTLESERKLAAILRASAADRGQRIKAGMAAAHDRWREAATADFDEV